MLLQEVANASAEVSGTASRTAKVLRVAQALELARADGPSAVLVVVSWLRGDLRQRRTGIGWTALRERPEPAAEATLTVAEVDEAFAQAEQLAGPGSQTARRALLADLLVRATGPEQRLLGGLVSGELRQGAQEGVMLEAVAKAAGQPEPAVRRAQTLAGDLGPVAVSALTGGADALRRLRPAGRAAAGADAGRVGADLGARRWTRTGPAGVEWKLDGIRVQVHRDGDEVRVFTRTLDDITDRLPEVVAAGARRRAGPGVVLDAEAIALRPDGRPRPFQETASRTCHPAPTRSTARPSARR